jgi:hypothetical protein
MKSIKLPVLFIALSIVFIALSCENNSDETGSANIATGSGILEVKATYTGTPIAGVTGVSDGSGKIFLYMYAALGTNAQNAPAYQASTAAEAVLNTEYTITINSIAPGNYYVVVFYDYKKHTNNTAGNTDRYELYNNVNTVSAASAVAVANDSTTSLIGISFDNTWLLDSGGAFDTVK